MQIEERAVPPVFSRRPSSLIPFISRFFTHSPHLSFLQTQMDKVILAAALRAAEVQDKAGESCTAASLLSLPSSAQELCIQGRWDV